MTSTPMPGRIQLAPQATADDPLAATAGRARRAFMGKALAMGAGAAASARAATLTAPASGAAAAGGDAAILQLPAHTRTLGQPVAARAYGLPSQWESNLQRRESPGLTRVSAAGVSFTPLQGMFGILTPNGLHFERHHQGWYDIDPSGHRLMVMGLVREPRVFTMDDLMRLPAVSRIHFIECGANTGMEWGNVAVPTVQYTHGMLSCCEYTGVKLSTLLDMVGADTRKGRYLLAEGADGASMTRTISMAAALDDAEFAELIAEARGAGNRQDVKALIERELAKSPNDSGDAVRRAQAAGDWKTSMALKAQQLNTLIHPTKG